MNESISTRTIPAPSAPQTPKSIERDRGAVPLSQILIRNPDYGSPESKEYRKGLRRLIEAKSKLYHQGRSRKPRESELIAATTAESREVECDDEPDPEVRLSGEQEAIILMAENFLQDETKFSDEDAEQISNGLSEILNLIQSSLETLEKGDRNIKLTVSLTSSVRENDLKMSERLKMIDEIEREDKFSEQELHRLNSQTAAVLESRSARKQKRASLLVSLTEVHSTNQNLMERADVSARDAMREVGMAQQKLLVLDTMVKARGREPRRAIVERHNMQYSIFASLSKKLPMFSGTKMVKITSMISMQLSRLSR